MTEKTGKGLTDSTKRAIADIRYCLGYSHSVRNKGRRFEKNKSVGLGIRISGYGEITSGKIILDLPLNVLGPGNPGSIWRSIQARRQDDGTVHWQSGRYGEEPLRQGGGQLVSLDDLLLPFEGTDSDFNCPPIAGERANGDEWPITAKVNIGNKATPGNHSFVAIMTYNDGNSWQTTISTSTLHVNTRREKYELVIPSPGVGVGWLTILFLILIALLFL